MPVNSCSDNGKPGYKWGDAGKCYTYAPGNDKSKTAAKRKALAQGIAIGDIDIQRANEITTTSMGSGIKNPQQGYPKKRKPKVKKVAEDLTQDEAMLAMALIAIAEKYGKFNEDGTGIWAGYEPPEENDEREIGVKCSNCVLYAGGSVCKIIEASVDPEGKCRFAVIPDGVVSVDNEENDDMGYEEETSYDFLNELLMAEELDTYSEFLDKFDLADLILISLIDSEEEPEDDEMEDEEEGDEEDEDDGEEEEEMSEHPELSPMQIAQYEGYESIVEKFGKFDQTTGRNGATGMALLPFLGSGQTHREGPYKEVVKRGLYFLVQNMKPKNGGGELIDGGNMYSHGICTAAITVIVQYDFETGRPPFQVR